jgi:hypothetical protein
MDIKDGWRNGEIMHASDVVGQKKVFIDRVNRFHPSPIIIHPQHTQTTKPSLVPVLPRSMGSEPVPSRAVYQFMSQRIIFAFLISLQKKRDDALRPRW